MHLESTLNQLKAALPNGELPASYGVYFKNTLVALCHALEDHILQTSAGSPDQYPLVLATFQQGKWYLQEADRYEEIAQCSRHIVISAMSDSGFVTHKTSQLPNVSLVNLDPQDTLIKEWNLIIIAPTYKGMVLCHELSEDEYVVQGKPETDSERKFYGLWTFDQTIVPKAAEILIARMRPNNPELADRVSAIYQEILTTPGPALADLSGVVSRILTYLQTSQQQVITLNRQNREMRELEGKALRISRNLSANKLQAFLRMAQRVDERDRANPVASLQVSALAETLGQILDLPTLQLRRLRLAGLLFRVGLVSAPPQIFTQTASEMDETTLAFWRDRATIGAHLLEAMPELAAVANIVAHQREYWDGSGKPKGLRATEIPIESRILGLVAYFQELTKARGTRIALSLGAALIQCQELSGSRFDPDLVESLATVVRLTEIGMMQLPQRPSQVPTVWLEESTISSPS